MLCFVDIHGISPLSLIEIEKEWIGGRAERRCGEELGREKRREKREEKKLG